MTAAAHTPGPWEVCGNKMWNGHVALAVTIDGGHTGFLISPVLSVTETDRANARLIAAAPDLLEALRDLAYEVQGQAALIGSECEHAHQRAVTSIAKAEGRS